MAFVFGSVAPTAEADDTIQTAAGDGKLDVVRSMVEAGHNVNAADSHGYTAVHAAASYAATDVLRFLLANGGNPNVQDVDGDTPLHMCEDAESVSLLQAAGANVNQPNAKGRPPMYNAMKEELHDVAAALTRFGAAPVAVPDGGFPDSDVDDDSDVETDFPDNAGAGVGAGSGAMPFQTM